jgi:hypothetical protein
MTMTLNYMPELPTGRARLFFSFKKRESAGPTAITALKNDT